MNTNSEDNINAQEQNRNNLSSISGAYVRTLDDPSQHDPGLSIVGNAVTNHLLDYQPQQSSSLATNLEGFTNNTASNNNLNQTFYVNYQSQNSEALSVYHQTDQTQYSIANLNALPSTSSDPSQNKEELLSLLTGWNLESIFEDLVGKLINAFRTYTQ